MYRTGRSNLVADALSRRPEVEGENHNQTGSDNDDEEWQAISYSTICEELEGVLGGVKVGRALKERIQVVQSAEDDIYGSCKIEGRHRHGGRISSSSIHHHGPSTKQRTIN